MKMKWIAFGGMLVFLFLATSCRLPVVERSKENNAQINLQLNNTETKEEQDVSDFSKGDLRAMFEQSNDENVRGFFYSNYNRDGEHEAFVLTEDKLWYMSSGGCELVLEDLQNVNASASTVLDFQTKSYFFLQFEDGFHNTLVYSVDNDKKVMEADISDKGLLSVNREGVMTLKVVPSGGEDQITYYLYYNVDNGFREYGAIPISKEQFLEYDGAEAILERIYERFGEENVAISFLYRSNNVIHMNISDNDGGSRIYYSMLLEYNNYSVKYLSDKIIKGRAETACILDIATFPTAFKHPVKSIPE